jgi:hypothetical protein
MRRGLAPMLAKWFIDCAIIPNAGDLIDIHPAGKACLPAPIRPLNMNL